MGILKFVLPIFFLLVSLSAFAQKKEVDRGSDRIQEETKSCEYRLRNSWGNDCPAPTDPYFGDCSKGEFWIQEKAVNQNTYRLSYLQELSR